MRLAAPGFCHDPPDLGCHLLWIVDQPRIATQRIGHDARLDRFHAVGFERGDEFRIGPVPDHLMPRPAIATHENVVSGQCGLGRQKKHRACGKR